MWVLQSYCICVIASYQKMKKENLLFEEMSIQGSIRGCLQGHLQHLHTFFQSGVSSAKPCGFKSLFTEEDAMIKTSRHKNQ